VNAARDDTRRGTRQVIRSLAPRRRAWTTPFATEWTRATAGIAIGFLAAHLLVMASILGQMASYMGRETWLPGPALIATSLATAVVAAALGAILATVPMLCVMATERLKRLDLGAIAWTAIGWVPTGLLAPRVMADVVDGTDAMGVLAIAAAICSGSWAGLLAHAAREATGGRIDRRTRIAVGRGCAATLAASVAIAWAVAPTLPPLLD
jgi:hypothetical protein